MTLVLSAVGRSLLREFSQTPLTQHVRVIDPTRAAEKLTGQFLLRLVHAPPGWEDRLEALGNTRVNQSQRVTSQRTMLPACLLATRPTAGKFRFC